MGRRFAAQQFSLKHLYEAGLAQNGFVPHGYFRSTLPEPVRLKQQDGFNRVEHTSHAIPDYFHDVLAKHPDCAQNPPVRVREWNRLFSPFDTHLRMVTVEWNCSKHGSGSFGFAFLCSHLAFGTGTGFNTLVDDDENESRPPLFVTRARRNDAAPAIISPRVYARFATTKSGWKYVLTDGE